MRRDDFDEILARLQESYPRQHEVLLMFLSGKTDDEIAASLYLTKASVRKNIERVNQLFFDPDRLSGDRRHRRSNLIALFCQFEPGLVKAPSDDQMDVRDKFIQINHLDSEKICYEALQQPGSLVRIKGPRLMGKTYTAIQTLDKMSELGHRTAIINLSLVDSKCLESIAYLLHWFCNYLSRDLELDNKIDDYWDEKSVGSKVSCTAYLEEYILPSKGTPLVICFDDVDLLFPYPDISREFLLLLRSWHDRSKTRPIWRELRLLIVHSTDVYINLEINQSPFNVGWPVELSELTESQVKKLANQHGPYPDHQGVNEASINALYRLVGGHPYLIQIALTFIKRSQDTTLDKLIEMAPTDAGIYRNHLLEHWNTLIRDQEIAKAFAKVIGSNTQIKLDPVHSYKLQRMGLVKLSGDLIEPRCDLYRLYFRNRLDLK